VLSIERQRVRAFFRCHPKIHATVHWLSAALGSLVLMQDKILGASMLFPADSTVPRCIAYGLGILAFSNLLVGKVEKVIFQTGAIPQSERITQSNEVEP
jgi:hypothetical protein